MVPELSWKAGMLGGWDAQLILLLLASKPYSLLASKPYVIVERVVVIFNRFAKIKNHARRNHSWHTIVAYKHTNE